MGNGLAVLASELSGFGLTWLVQSSVLLTLGLVAGPLVEAVGPGGAVGRLPDDARGCPRLPVRLGALGAAGFDGFSLRLPSPANDRVARGRRALCRGSRRSTRPRHRAVPT